MKLRALYGITEFVAATDPPPLPPAFLKMIAIEEKPAHTLGKGTKEKAFEKVTKDRDVKYASGKASEEDRTIAEANSDRSDAEAEPDATAECLARLVALSEGIEQQRKRERLSD